MITKIIIKRDVVKGKEKDFFVQLKNLRLNAMYQKGYISGETLLCAEKTNKVLVISKWETLEDWKNWLQSETRKELDTKIEELQENPTEYEHYVFPKYRAAADHGFPPPLQGSAGRVI